jgi:hypothetical protein
MKFEVGDRVIVKHSEEEGRVIEIIGEKMVMVDVRGVKFPAYTDQLDFPYFKEFTKGKIVAPPKPAKKYIDDIKKEKSSPTYQVAEGVWLLLFPVFSKDVFDDDVVEELKVHLVNQTHAGLKFHFWLNYRGQVQMELQNEVLALRDFYLLNVPFEDLNDNPNFDFEFSLLKHDKKKAEYYEANYKPRGKQVFKRIQELKERGDAFISIQLFESYPEKQPFEEFVVPDSPPLSKLAMAGFKVVAGKRIHTEDPPPTVIDLHIEKLTDAHPTMSSFEKLQFQLRSFEKWFDKMQHHYQKHGWVIHGVGSGKLRDEIHDILKIRKGVKSFIQQYHPWYGNGATEIYFD